MFDGKFDEFLGEIAELNPPTSYRQNIKTTEHMFFFEGSFNILLKITDEGTKIEKF